MHTQHEPRISTSSLLGAILLPVLTLSTALPAQTKYATVPAGYETTEAPNMGFFFGSLPDMRCQFFNQDHLRQVRILKDVAFRLEGGQAPSPFLYGGRSWSKVSLRVCETSYAKADRVFANNLSSTTVKVFDAAVSWSTPTVSTSKPAAWGSQVRFPFSRVWAYRGFEALNLDFTFTGGKLANNATWNRGIHYALDGVNRPMKHTTNFGGLGNNNCVNGPTTYAAVCGPVCSTYAKDTGDPKTSNKIAFNWRLQQFPNSAQVVCGLTITNSTTGVEIGNPCNKLYLGTPHLLMATATQTAFPYAIEFPVQRLWANYDKAAVGVSLITQAGYTQPQRNRFELSRAGYSYFPHQPQTIPGTKWMWASSSTAKSGSEIDGTSMPVLRLAY